MFITPFPSGPLKTNAYLITCPTTLVAAVVDPSPDSARKISSYITQHQLHLEKILLTHSHWDHIADVSCLKKQYSVPVSIHLLDVPNLEFPGADYLPLPFFIEGVKPDSLLKEDDEVKIGTLSFKVIFTPGHSPGGICFYCQEHALLISGDTLFRGSMGKISFPTSQPEEMWKSLKKLAQLPADTVVYPGHGPTTTIGRENWLTNAEKVFGS